MEPIVRYLDQTLPLDCPYGNVRRVVTGGLGGVANVHVVTVTAGSPHLHAGYDETYYVLAGTGTITMSGQAYPLRPGAVVVIPRGTEHALQADEGQTLEFVIFGTPAMSADDLRFTPTKPQ
ncbi:MAG: cupin domain-containing protein [Planctomycetes bacterium]|nr:cupin domain-containing protein [Planctomycetota bacterium]